RERYFYRHTRRPDCDRPGILHCLAAISCQIAPDRSFDTMQYDAIIIGSGQAGNPLAAALADHGWTVALIEKAHLGGTCINTGFTPTKTMVHRALVAHYARDAARWGVVTHDVNVDLPTIVAQKNKIVQWRRDGQQTSIDKRPNLHLYRGVAQFTGPHQLKVGDQSLVGERIFIDTGARALIPPIPGLDKVNYLTNESIMELTELPDHLVVLGGGYIGLEFGQMFSRFGSRVTVIQTRDQICPREDPEVAAELQRALESEGIRFLLSARTTKAERNGDQVVLTVEQPGGTSTLTGSHLLIATGRRLNTEELEIGR